MRADMPRREHLKLLHTADAFRARAAAALAQSGARAEEATDCRAGAACKERERVVKIFIIK